MNLSEEDKRVLAERLNRQDLTPVKYAQEFLDGCSDSACPYNKNKGGMRTNGGCRCRSKLVENGLSICGWLVQLARAHVTLAHEADIYVRERNKAEVERDNLLDQNGLYQGEVKRWKDEAQSAIDMNGRLANQLGIMQKLLREKGYVYEDGRLRALTGKAQS